MNLLPYYIRTSRQAIAVLRKRLKFAKPYQAERINARIAVHVLYLKKLKTLTMEVTRK